MSPVVAGKTLEGLRELVGELQERLRVSFPLTVAGSPAHQYKSKSPGILTPHPHVSASHTSLPPLNVCSAIKKHDPVHSADDANNKLHCCLQIPSTAFQIL